MPLSKFNSDEYVAHYTSLDTVVKYIIPTNKIRISSFEVLNDPYETVFDWLEKGLNISEITFEENDQNDLEFQKIKENIKKNIKIFSTTTFDEKNKNTADISNDIYCRPRMWAQYGDNHEGVCLIFDKKELHIEFESSRKVAVIADKVEYNNFISLIENSVTIEPTKLKSLSNDPYKLYEQLNNNQQLTSRFFRKHNDWESENEYRWLVYSEDESEFDLDFKKSLKAIVFGSKVNDRYFRTLKDDGIPLYSLKFNNGKYKVLEV